MTTAAPEKEAAAEPAPAYKLAPPRGKLKTGIPTDGTLVFAGLPKGGKTSLACSVPGCVVLELERGGADRLDGWIQDVANLEQFRGAMKAAVDDANVKAIAIDSLDVLSDWLEVEVAGQYGLDSISERKEGVNGFEVWKELRARFEGLMGYLRDSGKLAILIAHSKEPKIDSDGKVVTPAGIAIPGKIGGYIAAQADAIGHCYKRQVGSTTQYFVSFQGGPLGTWGSRIAELEDKTIALPRAGQWAALTAACQQGVAKPAPEKEEKAPAKTAAKGRR